MQSRQPFAAAVLSLAVIIAYGCGGGQGGRSNKLDEGAEPKPVGEAMNLTSSAFTEGERIPDRFTTEGADDSPPLTWSGAPAGTKSFALICDDPDAPSPANPAAEPWVHWVVYNIASDAAQLPAGVARDADSSALSGAIQGANSWPADNLGYRGPAPPPGSGVHRYFFRIYALDDLPPLESGATKRELLEAMEGHILGSGQLMGTFER